MIKYSKSGSRQNLPPKTARLVVLDTETTGVQKYFISTSWYNLFRDDEIVEIAAVEIEGGRLTGNQFHSYVSTRKPATASVRDIRETPDE